MKDCQRQWWPVFCKVFSGYLRHHFCILSTAGARQSLCFHGTYIPMKEDWTSINKLESAMQRIMSRWAVSEQVATLLGKSWKASLRNKTGEETQITRRNEQSREQGGDGRGQHILGQSCCRKRCARWGQNGGQLEDHRELSYGVRVQNFGLGKLFWEFKAWSHSYCTLFKDHLGFIVENGFWGTKMEWRWGDQMGGCCRGQASNFGNFILGHG